MLHEQTEFSGTVHQGVIVVDGEVELREGQSVKIILAESAPNPPAASPLGEFLLQFAGIADDLPADLPEHHDQYLYGTAKKAE